MFADLLPKIKEETDSILHFCLHISVILKPKIPSREVQLRREFSTISKGYFIRGSDSSPPKKETHQDLV